MARKKPTPGEVAFETTKVNHRVKGGEITDVFKPDEATPKPIRSESQTVPSIDVMDDWNDFVSELEESEKFKSAIPVMYSNIGLIMKNENPADLKRLKEVIKIPGTVEHSGMITKLIKVTSQPIAEKFLGIYERLIDKRISELETK